MLRTPRSPAVLLAVVFSLLLLGPDTASAEALIMDIEGMTCSGCRVKLRDALSPLPFVSNVITTDSGSTICIETKATHDRSSLDTAVQSLEYSVTNFRVETACPQDIDKVREPWAGKTEGRDAVVISQGERFELAEALVPGKFTIIDFGAPWCGPCHEAADRLAAYLDSHSDVAVRVVNLASANVTESYSLPAAKQHLEYAPGIPWFVVYNPKGKRIYQGLSLDKMLDAVAKKRAKLR
jgi:thiol-disulfide isomerase/thioredoxin